MLSSVFSVIYADISTENLTYVNMFFLKLTLILFKNQVQVLAMSQKE